MYLNSLNQFYRLLLVLSSILLFSIISNTSFAQSLLSDANGLDLFVEKITNLESQNEEESLITKPLLKPDDLKATSSLQFNLSETVNSQTSADSKPFSNWFSGISSPIQKKSVSSPSQSQRIVSKEWANLEFFGTKSLVEEVENLLISDVNAARKRYEEIEYQLQIEDRSRLKVQIFYYMEKWARAEQLAKVFIEEKPNSPEISLMYFFYNKSRIAQKKRLNLNNPLNVTLAKGLKPVQRSEFRTMFSKEALDHGERVKAVGFLLAELADPETAKMVDLNNLEKLVQNIQSPEALNYLYTSNRNIAWVEQRIPEMEMELLANMQRHLEAVELLDERLKTAQQSGNIEKVKQLQQMRIHFNVVLKVNPRRIGVVLPLSSSNAEIARLAQQTLNGLWMKLASYKQKSKENPISILDTPVYKSNESIDLKDQKFEDVTSLPFDESWELVVRDSYLNPEKAKMAIRDLVENEHVIAVIGPLARKTSEAAALEAERLRVPLISLSLTAEIPLLGDFVFRNNQSWKSEVNELLDYAEKERQARKFLILYAKTREGRQKMRLFWEAAKSRGHDVVAVEGFKENQKSMVYEFDTFTGKSQQMTYEDEKIFEELDEKEVPIHNFDAIFIAVGSGGMKRLRQIFPYSAVYKMKKTTFLGDSGWNNRALPFSPGLRGVKDPVFVDGFFPKLKTDNMLEFLNLHESILYQHQNYIGPSNYTAYAYDTLGLLMTLLENERNHSHQDLRHALLKMPTYPGVTGDLRFDSSGEIQRNMQLLTLRKGKIELLNPVKVASPES